MAHKDRLPTPPVFFPTCPLPLLTLSLLLLFSFWPQSLGAGSDSLQLLCRELDVTVAPRFLADLLQICTEIYLSSGSVTGLWFCELDKAVLDPSLSPPSPPKKHARFVTGADFYIQLLIHSCCCVLSGCSITRQTVPMRFV